MRAIAGSGTFGGYMTSMKWIVGLAVALLVGVGCGDKKDAPAGASGAAAESATGGSSNSAEDRAANLVVEGYNELTSATRRDVIDRYMGHTGPGAEGPSADKLDGVRLMALSAIHDRALDKANKSFAEAKKAAPSMPVTAAAEEMGAAATALAEAYRQSARYYEADEYKSDQGAKVPELHAAFMAKLAAYRTAVNKVGDALDERENAQMVTELAKYQPTTYSYWFRKTLMDAKAVVTASQQLDNPAKLTAANEAFQKTATELDAFTTSKGADVNKQFAALRRMAVENMATRSAKVVRGLAEEKPNESLLKADLDTLVQYYNSLVQTVNGLQEAEAQGYLK